jgi:hypothetical protein
MILAEHAVNRCGILAAAVRDCGKFRPADLGADISNHARGDDNDRKGHSEKEDRDEGDGRQRDHDAVAQRALSHADHGLDHDRQHRGLQSEEQCLDEPDLAEGGIDIA